MHHEFLVALYAHLDGMKKSIGLQWIWPVEDVVLVPQFVGNILEGLIQLRGLEREEGLASGFSGEIFHNLVAFGRNARDVGRDAVNDHIGLLRHLERLIAREAALVVFSIAENHHGPAKFVEGLIEHHLFLTGEKDGVVQRRAAAGPKTLDRVVQYLNVVSQVRY